MEQKIKTIFITSFHGLNSRVLGAGVLNEILKRGNFRVVLFVLDFKKEYYEKEFGGPNVSIEGVPPRILPWGTSFFKTISFYLLDTETMRIDFLSKFKRTGNFLNYASFKLFSFLGGFKIFRSMFRSLNFYFADRKFFSRFFEKYQPDLILSTDTKHFFDSQMVVEAKRRKIRTIGMVRSWDNLSAKGILRALPDKMIVHNEIMRDEAIFYDDVSPDNILISGIPHYDIFYNTSRTDKETFLKKIGADISKRLIMYAPTGEHYSDTDWQILKILNNFIESGEISNVQFLVRLPPGDTVPLHGMIFGKDFIFERPGWRFQDSWYKDVELTVKDCLHLADSIFNSEIVIAGPSTILVDSMVLNKPAIAVGFDGEETREYFNSVSRLFDYSHMRRLIDSGGVRLAKSANDLKEYIIDYLNDPNADMESRKRAAIYQCYKLDGRSSDRVAEFVVSFLKKAEK